MPGPLTQVEAIRRGLTLAALLWTEPRRVANLAEQLDASERDVQRLMAGLRANGLRIETEVRWRERYYRLVEMPEWLERAIRQLAAREVPRPLPRGAVAIDVGWRRVERPAGARSAARSSSGTRGPRSSTRAPDAGGGGTRTRTRRATSCERSSAERSLGVARDGRSAPRLENPPPRREERRGSPRDGRTARGGPLK